MVGTPLTQQVLIMLSFIADSCPTANERCARLMAEDPQREVRRAQLKKEKDTLAKAQDWLSSLSEDSPEMDVDQDELYTA